MKQLVAWRSSLLLVARSQSEHSTPEPVARRRATGRASCGPTRDDEADHGPSCLLFSGRRRYSRRARKCEARGPSARRRPISARRQRTSSRARRTAVAVTSRPSSRRARLAKTKSTPTRAKLIEPRRRCARTPRPRFWTGRGTPLNFIEGLPPWRPRTPLWRGSDSRAYIDSSRTRRRRERR